MVRRFKKIAKLFFVRWVFLSDRKYLSDCSPQQKTFWAFSNSWAPYYWQRQLDTATITFLITAILNIKSDSRKIFSRSSLLLSFYNFWIRWWCCCHVYSILLSSVVSQCYHKWLPNSRFSKPKTLSFSRFPDLWLAHVG